MSNTDIIINTVSDIVQVDPNRVLGKERGHEFARARHLIIHFCKEKLDYDERASCMVVNRDRSTYYNSVTKVYDRIATNKFYREEYRTIESILNKELKISSIDMNTLRFKKSDTILSISEKVYDFIDQVSFLMSRDKHENVKSLFVKAKLELGKKIIEEKEKV